MRRGTDEVPGRGESNQQSIEKPIKQSPAEAWGELLSVANLSSVKDKTAIVGIGCTEFSARSGRSETQLALEAIKAAIDDAGLSARDIDGLVRYDVDSSTDHVIQNNLGIANLRWDANAPIGGSATVRVIQAAVAGIVAGFADYVVCFRAMNERSGKRFGQSSVGGRVPGGMAFYAPFGLFSPAQQLAITARRHMHEYGTTSRQFGAVAAAFRKHANRNPRAMMHGRPMTIEDHQRSRLIADPLRLFDCCLETDGACAVVVTSAERARDLKQRPAYIMGIAQAQVSPHESVRPYYRPNPIDPVEHRNIARDLFGMAGVEPKDIDVAQIYDHFTPGVILALEGLGFCKPGEGGPFVEGGRIEWPDGELPLNTSGGHLSEGYIHGLSLVLEGVRQVRGASTCQVKNAELSLVSAAPSGAGGAIILRR